MGKVIGFAFYYVENLLISESAFRAPLVCYLKAEYTVDSSLIEQNEAINKKTKLFHFQVAPTHVICTASHSVKQSFFANNLA